MKHIRGGRRHAVISKDLYYPTVLALCVSVIMAFIVGFVLSDTVWREGLQHFGGLKRSYLVQQVSAQAIVKGISFPSSGELLITDDLDGCQSVMPFAWFDLRAGETWERTVDLRSCTSEDMGSYWYYAYVALHSKSPLVTVNDNLILKVTNETTGEVHFTTAQRNKPQYVIFDVTEPGLFTLAVHNVGRKTAHIRTTWTLVK